MSTNGGMKDGAATVENNMVAPQKKNHKQNYYMIQQLCFWVHPLKNRKLGLERAFVCRVHSSMVHHSQKVEMTQVSMDG